MQLAGDAIPCVIRHQSTYVRVCCANGQPEMLRRAQASPTTSYHVNFVFRFREVENENTTPERSIKLSQAYFTDMLHTTIQNPISSIVSQLLTTFVVFYR